MQLEFILENIRYKFNNKAGVSLAAPLSFAGDSPKEYGVEPALSKVFATDGFIGDTKQNGSCNVKELTLMPHCNGTHTETISHIVDDVVNVGNIVGQLIIPSMLITVVPTEASLCADKYSVPLVEGDNVITKELIQQAVKSIDFSSTALIIRTKTEQQQYNSNTNPAFLSLDAMEYINQLGIEHLLIDTPSVDKMYDEGKLMAHRIFWGVEENSKSITDSSQINKTITEMICVPDNINDGMYMLSLNIPNFCSDAAPSNPIIYPLEPA